MDPADDGRDEAPSLRVTVAVPTFRRDYHLRELLPLLVDQLNDVEHHHDGIAPEVLIVDNDPDGSARATVERFDDPRVRYVHEPLPGLTAARNRAIAASPDSAALVFIDDDGRPAPGWAQLLIGAWRQERCAAVAGRVLEEYECEPDAWIAAGGFFRRRTLPSGTVVPVAPAGNLLLDLDFLRRHELRFDPRFGLTGGEDTLLTRQITHAGGRIVWCDEARIVDLVPAERMNRRWVLRRSWSHGNTAAVIEQTVALSRRGVVAARARAAVGGSARVVGGGIRYVLGLLTCRLGDQARGLRTIWRGAGMFAGATGRVYEEYAR